MQPAAPHFEWRGAELVSVCRIPGDLLKPEVFILPGPVENDVPFPDTKIGAICGTPATWFLKSLNISFDWPATAWHTTHRAFPKNTTAPFFWERVMAFESPLAN